MAGKHHHHQGEIPSAALLLLSTLLTVPSSTVAAQECAGFSLGSCSMDGSSEVAEYLLPGDINAFVLCQDLCQVRKIQDFFFKKRKLL